MLTSTSHGPITCLTLARTAFGRPLYIVKAFWVDGVLIDTGCPATEREMLAWARAHAVREVVNTHHHEDHSGGDRLLQQALGLPIHAPARSVPLLAHFPHIELYRRVVWGLPHSVSVLPLGDVFETEHYRFEVVPTPGHSPDHACLFEREQGWLVSGDLYINDRQKYVRRDEDICQQIESLRRALALGPKLLVCSHAGFVEDACGALERKAAFWEGIGEQARALHAEGVPIPEMSLRLLGAEGRMTQISRGHFSKANLVRSLLGVCN
jgi:glyoxylase-like metal-dependent hydrolase (beta-lactamase superfamily II)